MPQPRIDANHARTRGRLLPINCSLEVCRRRAYRQGDAGNIDRPLGPVHYKNGLRSHTGGCGRITPIHDLSVRTAPVALRSVDQIALPVFLGHFPAAQIQNPSATICVGRLRPGVSEVEPYSIRLIPAKNQLGVSCLIESARIGDGIGYSRPVPCSSSGRSGCEISFENRCHRKYSRPFFIAVRSHFSRFRAESSIGLEFDNDSGEVIKLTLASGEITNGTKERLHNRIGTVVPLSPDDFQRSFDAEKRVVA